MTSEPKTKPTRKECAQGCCFHRSQDQQYLSNPPSTKCIETCCNCGQRWRVSSVPVPDEDHGPFGPPGYKYVERREPI